MPNDMLIAGLTTLLETFWAKRGGFSPRAADSRARPIGERSRKRRLAADYLETRGVVDRRLIRRPAQPPLAHGRHKHCPTSENRYPVTGARSMLTLVSARHAARDNTQRPRRGRPEINIGSTWPAAVSACLLWCERCPSNSSAAAPPGLRCGRCGHFFYCDVMIPDKCLDFVVTAFVRYQLRSH